MNGLSAIKEEIRVLKKMRISPVGDEFVSMMEVRGYSQSGSI